MAYKAIIADSFESDLAQVTAYISQVLQNPDAAAELLDQAEETVGMIGDYPFMFSFYPDEELTEDFHKDTSSPWIRCSKH